MRKDRDWPCERQLLGNGRRVCAMALAGAAMATALIWARMLSRMRLVVWGDGPGVIKLHSLVGAVPAAVVAHLGPGWGEGGERERPWHAERKLQKQHGAEGPTSGARSHRESLHR